MTWFDTVGVWDFSAEPPDPENGWSSLEDALETLMAACLPSQDTIVETARILDGMWWCGHFQNTFSGGPRISARLMSKLSDFALPLYLDCYFEEAQSERPAPRSSLDHND